jgi:hypothetical protein
VTGLRRINMWSGPRNVSTAMMYSWRQRSDTTVWDEPMYGHYLAHTGVDHAVRDEILATVPIDRDEIVELMLTRPCPTPVWFYKNMAHHLVGFDMGLVDQLDNFILTRDPRDMLPSLAIGLGRVPVMSDTGFDVQVSIVERLAAAGRDPIVVESRRLLTDPAAVLAGLCDRLGLQFDEAMLTWPAGPKPEDGVWAPHWYASVHDTTGFAPYRPKTDPFPPDLEEIYAECAPLFDRLQELTISA